LRHEDVGTGESVGWRAAGAAGKRGLESAGRRREVGRVSPTDNIGVAPGIDGDSVQEKVAEVFVAAATQVGGVSQDRINNQGLAGVVLSHLKPNLILSLEHVVAVNFQFPIFNFRSWIFGLVDD